MADQKKGANPAAEGAAARAQVKEQQNAEFYKREAAMRPTPTQEENDLAKVGALDPDDREDDGSEWEEDSQRRVAEGKLGGGVYNTRSMEAGGGQGQQQRQAPPPPPPRPAPKKD